MNNEKLGNAPETDELEETVDTQELAAQWYEQYEKPDIMERFIVHMIDTAVFYAIYAPLHHLVAPAPSFNVANFFITYFFFIYINAGEWITWIPLYLTNGYTLGKKIYAHRVHRLDGERLKWKDVIVRSLLIKGYCDTFSCGIMNIVSIIIAYAKPNFRPLHDVAASTITVKERKSTKNEKPEPRVEFDDA